MGMRLLSRLFCTEPSERPSRRAISRSGAQQPQLRRGPFLHCARRVRNAQLAPPIRHGRVVAVEQPPDFAVGRCAQKFLLFARPGTPLGVSQGESLSQPPRPHRQHGAARAASDFLIMQTAQHGILLRRPGLTVSDWVGRSGRGHLI
jgi:hypothetical protein